MTQKIYESYDRNHLFKAIEMSDVDTSSDVIAIEINKKQTYQKIDGFGASFTDSSAYLIDKVLSDKDKEEVMTHLFADNDGIGLSLVRNPMGASDYSRSIYSYNDIEEGQTDLELTQFTIDHDRESILPLTKWAMELNPDLKLMASPWSAPAWMKTTKSMIGGKLLEEYYEVYARYFEKFIQAYKNEGISVYGITPQNEPLFVPPHYPGMELLAEEAATFISDYLKPTLDKAGHATKIFGYDHNWDRIDYPITLLDEAADNLDGIAWHWYGGKAINQARVQQFFPDKEIHFTEGSGGEWIPEFELAFSNLMRTGIDIMRHGSKSFILWNMALDENNGPTVPGFGESTCRGLLKINQLTKEYEYTLDYYGLAHFSKFVRPGASRIFSSEEDTIKTVSFENIDHSLVVILFNDSNEQKVVQLTGDVDWVVSLKAKSALTVVFEG